MSQFNQYFGRVQGFRGQFGGLPPWCRTVLSIFAIPGLILMALSIVLFVVSLLALLLLTVPVYSLLQRLVGGSPVRQSTAVGPAMGFPFGVTFGSPASAPHGVNSGGVKHVEATVIDPDSV